MCSIRFHNYLLQFRSHVLDTGHPASLFGIGTRGPEVQDAGRLSEGFIKSRLWGLRLGTGENRKPWPRLYENHPSQSLVLSGTAVAQLWRFTNYKNIQEYSRFLQILTHFPFTWHDRLSKGWHDANFATRVSHSLGVWRNWRPPSCSREALQGVVKRIQTFLGKGWVRLVDPYFKYR